MTYGNGSGPLCQEGPQGDFRNGPPNCSTENQPKRRAKILHPHSKRASMLRAFLAAGDRGINCFESALRHHDFVLRSTVSDYRNNLGVSFNRKFETVPGHGGAKVDCVRYSLTPEGAQLARELLGAE